ncbi:C2H2 finger domain protein [Talaromyces pinophilus]|uniref:C2H2 finger domain protein n=1 Tax=Talaromyces pinophilus TaxID=128442 RepID=A0A510NX14_TALPI|nr:C2H2 finger domain protein [Talaromyces pinophilus]
MGATRRLKTKRRTRDYDQIRQDLTSRKHLQDFKDTKDAEDLPGLGQHYCVECAKWFETEHNLVAHRKGKNHKRRLRILKEDVHTHKTAEQAVGLGVDNGKREQTLMDTDEPDA